LAIERVAHQAFAKNATEKILRMPNQLPRRLILDSCLWGIQRGGGFCWLDHFIPWARHCSRHSS
jgi:hypothetical protein